MLLASLGINIDPDEVIKVFEFLKRELPAVVAAIQQAKQDQAETKVLCLQMSAEIQALNEKIISMETDLKSLKILALSLSAC